MLEQVVDQVQVQLLQRITWQVLQKKHAWLLLLRQIHNLPSLLLKKARTRGTAQSDNPLLNRMKLRSGMRAGTPTVQDPKVQSLGKGNQSLKNNRYAGRSPLMNDNRDAYDMVLDYLLSEGTQTP